MSCGYQRNALTIPKAQFCNKVSNSEMMDRKISDSRQQSNNELQSKNYLFLSYHSLSTKSRDQGPLRIRPLSAALLDRWFNDRLTDYPLVNHASGGAIGTSKSLDEIFSTALHVWEIAKCHGRMDLKKTHKTWLRDCCLLYIACLCWKPSFVKSGLF